MSNRFSLPRRARVAYANQISDEMRLQGCYKSQDHIGCTRRLLSRYADDSEPDVLAGPIFWGSALGLGAEYDKVSIAYHFEREFRKSCHSELLFNFFWLERCEQRVIEVFLKNSWFVARV